MINGVQTKKLVIKPSFITENSHSSLEPQSYRLDDDTNVLEGNGEESIRDELNNIS